MRVGFLGHDKCDGLGEDSFNPNIEKKWHHVSTAKKHRYGVDLSIENEGME